MDIYNNWRGLPGTAKAKHLEGTQAWQALQFLVKYFIGIHKMLLEEFNEMLTEREWLQMEKKNHPSSQILWNNQSTKLQSHNMSSSNLQTLTALSATISQRMVRHLEENNLVPEEQKKYCKGSYECRNHLFENRQKKKGPRVVWIDYQKAFTVFFTHGSWKR